MHVIVNYDMSSLIPPETEIIFALLYNDLSITLSEYYALLPLIQRNTLYDVCR